MEISQNNYRQTLFPYAYNILGSVDDAEDAIQDVMEKHFAKAEHELDNESAYLIRSVINHAINLKKRQNRIVEHGVWLPEPLATDRADEIVNRQELISYSMLVLLEYLTPQERAVFILKEAYDYSHDEIATTLAISVDKSRKLLSRAKFELNAKKRMKTFTSFRKPAEFLNHYIDVIQKGDTATLEQMLSEHIVLKTDGGKIKIVNAVTIGIADVVKLVDYVYKNYQLKFTVRVSTVNHEPALLFYDKGNLINCQVFELTPDGDQIESIYSIVDPQKLKNLLSEKKIDPSGRGTVK